MLPYFGLIGASLAGGVSLRRRPGYRWAFLLVMGLACWILSDSGFLGRWLSRVSVFVPPAVYGPGFCLDWPLFPFSISKCLFIFDIAVLRDEHESFAAISRCRFDIVGVSLFAPPPISAVLWHCVFGGLLS